MAGAHRSQGRRGMSGDGAGLPGVAAPAAPGLARSQLLLAVGWELGCGQGTVGSQSPLLGG